MKMKHVTILLGLLPLVLLWAAISIYPNWLWFQNLNFAPVFWTMVLGKFGLATNSLAAITIGWNEVVLDYVVAK